MCECGNLGVKRASNLISGNTQSCGCLQNELTIERTTKHGQSGTKLYLIWQLMRARSYNPKAISYKWYGAKGIKVCKEWLDDFMNFYNWAMSNGYKEGLTIDRIDNDGDYCPTNCQWLTISENSAKDKRKPVCCVETSEIFESAKAAALKLGRGRNAVTAAIRCGRKCAGYTWRYV